MGEGDPPGVLGRRGFMSGVLVAGGVAALAACSGDGDGGAAPQTPAPTAPGRLRYADLRGITTNGTVVPGLYDVAPGGPTTAAVVEAGVRFVEALTPAQRQQTLHDVRSDQWLEWSAEPDFWRNGVSLRDLGAEQRRAALRLLETGLSANGYAATTAIRRLDGIAGRLLGQGGRFGRELYWVNVLGTPSGNAPWGWQLQGNHLVLNYFVVGDQVVLSPALTGAEPRIGYDTDGTRIEVFAREITDGLAMINALTGSARLDAIVSGAKSGSDMTAEAGRDNAILPYEGVNASTLGTALRRRLVELTRLFVGMLDDAHAAVKMAEVVRHLDDTYFAWIGGTESGSAFYYRIQSPVLLVEFDCQAGGRAAAAVGPAAVRANARAQGVATAPATAADASRNHVHCVVRTPNAGDYGLALLRDYLRTEATPTS